jgi:hypothetical protein
MIAGLVTLAVRSWVALDRQRMKKLRFHRGQFYDLAARILRGDDTTDEMLDDLKRMTADIDSRHRFSVLAAVVKNFSDSVTADVRLETTQTKVTRDWHLLLLHYWLAISYLKGVQGILFRSALVRVLYPGAVNNALAVSYRHNETRSLLPV